MYTVLEWLTHPLAHKFFVVGDEQLDGLECRNSLEQWHHLRVYRESPDALDGRAQDRSVDVFRKSVVRCQVTTPDVTGKTDLQSECRDFAL